MVHLFEQHCFHCSVHDKGKTVRDVLYLKSPVHCVMFLDENCYCAIFKKSVFSLFLSSKTNPNKNDLVSGTMTICVEHQPRSWAWLGSCCLFSIQAGFVRRIKNQFDDTISELPNQSGKGNVALWVKWCLTHRVKAGTSPGFCWDKAQTWEVLAVTTRSRLHTLAWHNAGSSSAVLPKEWLADFQYQF